MISQKELLASLSPKKSKLTKIDKDEIIRLLEKSEDFEIMINLLKNIKQTNTFKSLMLACTVFGFEAGFNYAYLIDEVAFKKANKRGTKTDKL